MAMNTSLASTLGTDPRRWQRELARISDLLTGLDSDDAYQELERGAVGNPPALTGESLALALVVVNDVRVLFQQYSLVYDRVGNALSTQSPREVERELTEPLPLDDKQVLADQLPDLLPSWQQAGSVTYPVAVLPAVLLASLAGAATRTRASIDSFRVARDVVGATTAQATAIVDGYERAAQRVGLGSVAEIVSARPKIEALVSAARADPIGSAARLHDQVVPVLDALSGQIKAAQATRDTFDDLLRRAGTTLQQLEDDHRRAVTGMQDTARKVLVDPSTLRPPAVSDAQLADLRQWLEQVNGLWQRGRWALALSSLQAWHPEAGRLLAAESAVAAANYGPLERLSLLRGRLEQLHTVAIASQGFVAVAGTREAEIRGAYAAARAALSRTDSQPRVDLDTAAVLVETYAALVDPLSAICPKEGTT